MTAAGKCITVAVASVAALTIIAPAQPKQRHRRSAPATGRATVTGRFVDSLVAPPRSGGPDYGLNDFGPVVTSRPVIGDEIAVAAAEPPAVELGQTVCYLYSLAESERESEESEHQ